MKLVLLKQTLSYLMGQMLSCALCPCLMIVLEQTGKNYSKFFLIYDLVDHTYMSQRTLSLLLVQHEFTIVRAA